MKNRANKSLIGREVLVHQIGQDPLVGIISKIDQATGLILEVIVKDKDKLERIIEVKDKVVSLLPWLVKIVLQLLGKI